MSRERHGGTIWIIAFVVKDLGVTIQCYFAPVDRSCGSVSPIEYVHVTRLQGLLDAVSFLTSLPAAFSYSSAMGTIVVESQASFSSQTFFCI